MRVLHACTFDIVAGGILDQLRWEQQAARELALPWDTLVWSRDTPTEPFMHQLPPGCGPLKRRYLFARELLKRRRDYDVIIVRYDPNNPFMLWAGSRMPRWVSEHHAIEYLEHRVSGTAKGRLMSVVEKVSGRWLLGQASAVAAVTDEILSYEKSRISGAKPGYVMPNGINVADMALPPDERGGSVKVFFVATNFAPWHGLDRVLDALDRSSHAIELHLVGNLGADSMRSIEACRRSSDIFMHGFVKSPGMPALLRGADLCLSAFNSIATGLTQGSRLKVRHTLAMGIPVIGAEADSSFPASFPYYRQTTQADFDEIVSFALECRAVSRQQIRDESRSFIDKTTIVRNLHGWLENLCRGAAR